MPLNVMALLLELINILNSNCYTSCWTQCKDEEIVQGCKAWVKKKNQFIFRFSNHNMYVWPSNPLYYNAATLIYTQRVRWRDFTVSLEFLQIKKGLEFPHKIVLLLGKLPTIQLFIHTHSFKTVLMTTWISVSWPQHPIKVSLASPQIR